MAHFAPESSVPVPAQYRYLYVQANVSVKMHGRSRSGKAKKPHHLHGRTRAEPLRNDPFKHRGQAHGQH